ncbi:MAG: glycerate-2-kinase family protein, partial [Lachnospiraceae bacterium]|nr:glycerate-2-kinase family protein [Lachnospiraceae bacterium]
MRADAYKIIEKTIADCMPDSAVQNSLKALKIAGRVYVAAIGKAAWVMAKAAADFLGERLERGVVVTKYGHLKGMLNRFEIVESGHPTPDENSILGAHKVTGLLGEASKEDTVLFLLSGGGSALVEVPAEGLSLSDIQKVTQQLLFCGAGITEINVIRKKLSAIKGGKLAGFIHGAR